MKLLACCLCSLALTTFSAHARLGETQEQLAQRFGPPSETPKFDDSLPGVTYKFFSRHKFNIYVGLLHGKSAFESYQTDGLNDGLIKQLLEIESEGHAWSTPQNWPGSNSGRLRDDGAIAYTWQSAIIFKTKEYAEKESALHQAADDARKPRLDGF